MLRPLLISTLCAALFSIASCQASESPLPTLTREPTSRPTQIPTAKVTGSPVCFEAADLNPISFTPDSKMLALRAPSGVQIFNLETLKEENFIQAPRTILAAALSPNGQTLAWSFDDHTIQLIRMSDGQILKTLKGHTDIVFKLRFTPNSDKLLSASHDGTVRVWDSQDGSADVIQVGSEVLGIGVSPDGTRLATIPFDGPVELGDLVSSEKTSALGEQVVLIPLMPSFRPMENIWQQTWLPDSFCGESQMEHRFGINR